jgi:hypothetical protein
VLGDDWHESFTPARRLVYGLPPFERAELLPGKTALVRGAVRAHAAVPSLRVLAIAGLAFCLAAEGLIEWGGAIGEGVGEVLYPVNPVTTPLPLVDGVTGLLGKIGDVYPVVNLFPIG